jgi:hypothetical protein
MDDDMSTPKAAVEPKPGRRRLLKALAGAGGIVATGALLPERWTRPVVESIIVPAHAQATGVLAQSYAGSNVAPPGPAPASRGLGERILNTIIPAASANGNLVSVCLQPGAGTVDIQIYDCFLSPGGAFGSGLLNAGGVFDAWINPWTVTGTLGPSEGTVDLSSPNVGSYVIDVFADAPCVQPLCNGINATSYRTEIFTDTA